MSPLFIISGSPYTIVIFIYYNARIDLTGRQILKSCPTRFDMTPAKRFIRLIEQFHKSRLIFRKPGDGYLHVSILVQWLYSERLFILVVPESIMTGDGC